jgi:hypothetical protein
MELFCQLFDIVTGIVTVLAVAWIIIYVLAGMDKIERELEFIIDCHKQHSKQIDRTIEVLKLMEKAINEQAKTTEENSSVVSKENQATERD